MHPTVHDVTVPGSVVTVSLPVSRFRSLDVAVKLRAPEAGVEVWYTHDGSDPAAEAAGSYLLDELHAAAVHHSPPGSSPSVKVFQAAGGTAVKFSVMGF